MTGISGTDHRVADSAQRVPVWRRTAGLLALAVAGIALALFVLGVWNPWRYVVLLRYFGSPAIGLVVVAGLAFVGSWLAFPVRNESAQRGRSRWRIVTAVAAFVGMLCWGLTGTLFTPAVTVLEHSPSGERTVALVEQGRADRQLHVWVGTGLFARDVGSIGYACGDVRVAFLSRDRIAIGTSYGDWEIDLDPATGKPLQVLGPRCADGPGPATLGW